MHDGAGGRAYNLTNDYEVTVAEFFRLAGEGLGKRIRFVPIPVAMASVAFRALKLVARVSGGRLSVISNSSIGFLTRDNPFTSDRARYELGWSPPVHPREAVPEAFRWWLANAKGATSSSRPSD
jgi:nucleoside-diphosphate-sugar epimerase